MAMRTLGSSRHSFLVPALLSSLGLACSAGEPGASGDPDLGKGGPGVLTSGGSEPPLEPSEPSEPGEPGEPSEPGPGNTDPNQGSPSCAGVNSFAASLAVAVANELHRWDVLSDFELLSGKLALSPTGELHCQSGCGNIRAILSLQDTAAAAIPGHDPLAFRAKLASWYTQQASALSQLVEQKLVVQKGVYRLRNRLSGKYMQVDMGSQSADAAVEQRSAASQPGADEWRLVLEHTSHRLINVRSGMCLALSQDSAAQDVSLVQQSCSSSALQRFGFAKNVDYYAVFSKTGKALRARDDNTADDVAIVQGTADISQLGQQWAMEPVGGTLSPDVVAEGMYTIVCLHSGKTMTVDSDDPGENGGVEQDTFSSGDDRHQWYVARVEANKYDFINRQTGKCLDLESTSTAGRLLQRSCSGSQTQRFTLIAAGDGSHVIYSLPGNAVEIVGDTATEAPVVLGSDSSWSKQRRFLLTPVVAAEPHRLSFSRSSEADASCGDYLWYDIEQPSGLPLRSPDDAFVQLMFAGGRQSLSSNDENPYLDPRPHSGQVAVAPLPALNGTYPAGSCVASPVLYDATGASGGRCCERQDGSAGQLQQASWSPSLFLCR